MIGRSLLAFPILLPNSPSPSELLVLLLVLLQGWRHGDRQGPEQRHERDHPYTLGRDHAPRWHAQRRVPRRQARVEGNGVLHLDPPAAA